MHDVERILESVDQRAPRAPEELFALVYDELRKLAKSRLSQESPGQTFQPTALVHEVYLRLVAPYRDQKWDSTGHFFAAGAESMRRILVDHARSKKRIKRGGDAIRVEMEMNLFPVDTDAVDLVGLDQALNELAEQDPDKARLVVMRYFGGMTMEESCEVLGISWTTGQRYWKYARAWLFRKLSNKTSAG